MVKSNIYHTNKKRRKHAKLCQSTKCPFCNLNERILAETGTLAIIENAAPYDWFDNLRVKEHLLLIPKRHVEGLHELNKTESREYFELLSKYEKNGYSIFSRDIKNNTRSQTHLHTHLIKTNGGQLGRFIIVVRKLGIRIVK
jgi:Diadenosine tetraphosphate (Ap4A) hydrolase and other HIT family hydrolases